MDRRLNRPAAESIRAHRRSASLSQRQLAEEAAVSIGVVRDLEQGLTTHPHADSVKRLATALGLDRRQAAEFAREMRGDAKPTRRANAPRRPRRAAGLRLSILGSLVANSDGLPVTLGRGMQRAVLGLLALHPNMTLSREAIIDALWGDNPPATAVSMIQSQVSKLRRLLIHGPPGDCRSELLISTGTSYRLQVTVRELDQLAFRKLAARARQAHIAGQLGVACGWYSRALRLCRGKPLADVDVLRTHPALANLSQTCADVVLGYADAAFSAGWHNRALPYLRQLAHQEPLDERAHAGLMTALAASGQQAAAMRVYEQLRRRLDHELGLRPGAELADSFMRVLRQELSAAPGFLAVSDIDTEMADGISRCRDEDAWDSTLTT